MLAAWNESSFGCVGMEDMQHQWIAENRVSFRDHRFVYVIRFDFIEMIGRAQINCTVRDGWRRLSAFLQLVLAQHLECVARGNDGGSPLLVRQINAPASNNR